MESKSGSRETRAGARAKEDRWTEHLRRAADAFCDEMGDAVPNEFSRHARGSLREALLAIRSVIDTGIDKLNEEEKQKSAPRKVEVE